VTIYSLPEARLMGIAASISVSILSQFACMYAKVGGQRSLHVACPREKILHPQSNSLPAKKYLH
jgi:hypothetical protein